MFCSDRYYLFWHAELSTRDGSLGFFVVPGEACRLLSIGHDHRTIGGSVVGFLWLQFWSNLSRARSMILLYVSPCR